MILAIDVYYHNSEAKAVGVLFNWKDSKPQKTIIEYIDEVAPYEPGKFYKRELPCILELLKKVDLSIINAIIVDGHIYISNEKEYGLGGFLWESLNRKIPVIGVAKNSFHNTEKISFPILRGLSKKPLFISTIDIDIDFVIERIINMKGNFRIPNLLKILDTETRSK